MTENTRTTTLAALKRSRALRGTAAPEAAAPDAAAPPSTTAFLGKDPWDDFAAKSEDNGARVIRAKTLAEAKDALRALLAEYEVSSAVTWDHPDLEALGVSALLKDCGATQTTPGAEDYTAIAADADMGITAMDALLAESGSVLVQAAVAQPRCTSLLPPVHLAIARPGRTLPDIAALAPWLRSLADESGQLPSAVHAITGPSSTGDIEMILVKGVHGPITLILLIIDQ